jgi:hypothetical protein
MAVFNIGDREKKQTFNSVQVTAHGTFQLSTLLRQKL